MDDRFNTTAGWVLFAGVIALGSSLFAGEMFHSGRPETMGYPIEGVELEGGEEEAEQPIAAFLANADIAAGEQSFAKCAACHNIVPGGANALGPALYGVMGNPIAGTAGYAFSDALSSKGGTWGWEEMSDWIASPRSFAPGTKMTFAGISNPQERANLLAFMNSRDDSPLPIPDPPVTPEAEAEDGAAEDEGEAADPSAADAPAAAPSGV